MNWLDLGNFISFVAIIPLILIFLFATPWAITGIVCSFKDDIKRGLIMIIAALVWAICLIASLELVDHVRLARLMRLGNESKPLIAAIKQYQSDNGTPPNKLSDLIPLYAAKVPATGIPVYPDFHYNNSSWTPPNQWELSVSTGIGMGFDQFLYLPQGNYPLSGYGGVLKPLGEWAYVYE